MIFSPCCSLIGGLSYFFNLPILIVSYIFKYIFNLVLWWPVWLPWFPVAMVSHCHDFHCHDFVLPWFPLPWFPVAMVSQCSSLVRPTGWPSGVCTQRRSFVLVLYSYNRPVTEEQTSSFQTFRNIFFTCYCFRLTCYLFAKDVMKLNKK